MPLQRSMRSVKPCCKDVSEHRKDTSSPSLIIKQKELDYTNAIQKRDHVELTTGDLTKLFDTELKMDYINGTAEITNKKT